MYKLLVSILLCSCVSLSKHERSLKKIEDLQIKIAKCQADTYEYQNLILLLKEEKFKNELCKRKVHQCSLKINEMYDFLHKPIDE